jgi:hypothetical protein
VKLRRLEGIEYYQKKDSGQWLNLGSTLTLSRGGGLNYGGIFISVCGMSRGQIFVLLFVGMREAPLVGTWNLYTNAVFALEQRKGRAGTDRRTFRTHNDILPAAWYSGVAVGERGIGRVVWPPPRSSGQGATK